MNAKCFLTCVENISGSCDGFAKVCERSENSMNVRVIFANLRDMFGDVLGMYKVGLRMSAFLPPHTFANPTQSDGTGALVTSETS